MRLMTMRLLASADSVFCSLYRFIVSKSAEIVNIERTNSISLEFELNNRSKFRAHTCHHVAVVLFPPDVELREDDRTLHQ